MDVISHTFSSFKDMLATYSPIILFILLILVIIIVWKLFASQSFLGEFRSAPLAPATPAAYGSLSRFTQEFSSTNQSGSNIARVGYGPREGLVGSYEPPVTNSVDQMLDTYQHSQGKNKDESFRGERGLYTESFATNEDALKRILNGN